MCNHWGTNAFWHIFLPLRAYFFVSKMIFKIMCSYVFSLWSLELFRVILEAECKFSLERAHIYCLQIMGEGIALYPRTALNCTLSFV